MAFDPSLVAVAFEPSAAALEPFVAAFEPFVAAFEPFAAAFEPFASLGLHAHVRALVHAPARALLVRAPSHLVHLDPAG